MDDDRVGPARDALSAYCSGPDAPIVAAAQALARAELARSVVLVEGVSDQVALETLAARRGRDLEAERIVVVPVGGAHAIGRHLVLFGPQGAGLGVTGLCDEGEESAVRRGLRAAGFGTPLTRRDMEQLGFFVCVADLEDELIRAAGRPAIEALLESEGDLGSFRTLQKQPAWRHERFPAQMRRFLGAGSRRKLRYAQLLVGTVDADRIPRPLDAVLATGGPDRSEVESVDRPGPPARRI